jgi:hypothetical protein
MKGQSFLEKFGLSIVIFIWNQLYPTLAFYFVCAFAVALDCITAWRLNKRIRAKYSKEIADGKLKSDPMKKMFGDLCIVLGCIFLAYQVDKTVLAQLHGLYLANYITAIFCAVEFISILENESSCNGAVWAKWMQQIVADKTNRHIIITPEEFDKLKADNNDNVQ